MQKDLVDPHPVRSPPVLLAVFGDILLGDEHPARELDGPLGGCVRDVAGDYHIVQLMHDCKIEEQPACLCGIMMATVGLVDLVADVACEPDDPCVPDLQAAVSHHGAVKKRDVEAVCGHMLSLGDGLLGLPENQFYLIVMQVRIVEHEAIIHI